MGFLADPTRQQAVPCHSRRLSLWLALLFAASLGACAGTHRVVMDADNIPSNTLLDEEARVEITFDGGSTKTGQFAGLTDSLMYLSTRTVPLEVARDSIAYVTYLHSMDHTAKQQRLGLLRGIGIGILDAAILTLIYSSADNSVDKGTLFAITAITTAIPLTIYFTVEAGKKGGELDEKAIADVAGRMARETK
jgi:hypothetical protein